MAFSDLPWLLITLAHPVHVDGAWRRSGELAGALAAPAATRVYNLVLDRSHMLLVGGHACATWGHGMEGDGIAHAFYGTRRVVDSLKAMAGWERGAVTVYGVVRGADGRVCGLIDARGYGQVVADAEAHGRCGSAMMLSVPMGHAVRVRV